MHSRPTVPDSPPPPRAPQTARSQITNDKHENAQDLRARLLKMILTNEQLRQSQVPPPAG